ncbi:MAG TPA: hypothetical protein VMZ32_02270 [Gammaproteobacteria bacterium]|nr:hypothetical protein [Gammaproteobacteria bacterium]
MIRLIGIVLALVAGHIPAIGFRLYCSGRLVSGLDYVKFDSSRC